MILVTGFEPWDNWDPNSSGETALALAGTAVDGHEIISVVVPVEYGKDTAQVLPLIDGHNPACVISLGLNSGASALNLERIAVNLRWENEGESLIQPDGPAAYFSTLPLQEMRSEIERESVAVQYSTSAGTFLCNHLMYSVLDHLSGRSIPSGFIHVPRLPEQAEEGDPSMPLEEIVRGVRAAIRATVDSQKQA